MKKDKSVDAVFKILPLFEMAKAKMSEDYIQSYVNYLSRVYIQVLGMENIAWAQMINGLMELGMSEDHAQVKRIVLHLTNESNKDGVGNAV